MVCQTLLTGKVESCVCVL